MVTFLSSIAVIVILLAFGGIADSQTANFLPKNGLCLLLIITVTPVPEISVIRKSAVSVLAIAPTLRDFL
jgi:hypothetical protein